jgi:hypothetical protein
MTIEERLEKLEKEYKGTKRKNLALTIVALLAITMGVIGVASSKPINKIHANEFILEDEKGRMRALLGMVEGEPGLSLFDEKNKLRAFFNLSNGEPRLALVDENGKPRAAMVMNNGKPVLALSDENDNAIWSAP